MLYLLNLLKKERERHLKFEMDKRSSNCFRQIKTGLKMSQVLAYPNMNEPFRVSSDMSNKAKLEFVLGQNKGHVIPYGEKSFSKSHLNWTTTARMLCSGFISHFQYLQTIRH